MSVKRKFVTHQGILFVAHESHHFDWHMPDKFSVSLTAAYGPETYVISREVGFL
jgi:hypothetical protein